MSARRQRRALPEAPVGLGIALLFAGCTISPLDDELLPCPCTDGFTCVEDFCVRDDARRDAGPGRDAGVLELDAAPSDVDGAMQVDAFVADLDGGSSEPDAPAPMPDAFVAIDAATPLDTGVVAADGGGGPITLQGYFQGTCGTGALRLGPSATDESPALAARLVPADVAGMVTAVHFELAGSSTISACNAGVAVRVYVWAGFGETPAAMPLASPIAIPGVSDGVNGREIDITLPSPVALVAGASLFVAVEADSGDVLCMATCLRGDADPMLAYGSFALVPTGTFSWAARTRVQLAVTADLR